MNTAVQLFPAALAFAAFMLASGELLASARKSGRRTGKGKAGKFAPKSGSQSGAAGPRPGARQPSRYSRHAPGARQAPGSPPALGGEPSRRVHGIGGARATVAAGIRKFGESLAAAAAEVRGSGGSPAGVRGGRRPPEGFLSRPVPGPAWLPESPPWEFPSDGTAASAMVLLTAMKPPQWADPSWSPGRTWDALRGVYRASMGEDDPRVRCAMSRAARAVSLDPGSLGPAAALAAGAAELFSRYPYAASGGGEDLGAWPRAREEKFALDVLEATRAALARTPGRDPGAPFPAPAYRLGTAMYPGPSSPVPARPGPGELRAALAAAERDGAGSAGALSARSRLGEAVADAEAWARASVTTLFSRSSPAAGGSGSPPASGPSGDCGDSGDSGAPAYASRDGSALGLLRSASEGLDALLGRTHPDSLDARERLARRLAGFSGPGLPPCPLAVERPPDADVREAMEIFLETAAARAEAASGPGHAGPARRAGSPAPPPGAEGAAGLLRHTGDERALAAAAAAAECALITGMTPEQAVLVESARLAAMDTLDRKDTDRPAALKFMALGRGGLYRGDDSETAAQALRLLNIRQKRRFGASSRETVETALELGTLLFVSCDFDDALGSFSESLEALEEADGSWAPSAADAPRGPVLPPGRAGRDRLVASTHLAGCLLSLGAASLALGALGPFLDSLPRLPPGREPEGDWPWPPELAGNALAFAGEACADLDDYDRGESLLRLALDLMGPEPEDFFCQTGALEELAGILGERGGRDRLRESADLREREAGILFRLEGPDSSEALDALDRAASCRDSAGDFAAALELHRKILAERKRLLGPMDEATRESRAEIRRLEEKCR